MINRKLDCLLLEDVFVKGSLRLLVQAVAVVLVVQPSLHYFLQLVLARLVQFVAHAGWLGTHATVNDGRASRLIPGACCVTSHVRKVVDSKEILQAWEPEAASLNTRN